MTVPAWAWAAFLAFVLAMLALDLFVLHRRAREVSLKEAGAWTAVWVAIGLGFAVLLWAWRGGVAAKLLRTDVYEAPVWASPAFIAVVLAAAATLSIRDNRRATQQPALGDQARTDVPQPVESAAGNAEPLPSQPERRALGHGGGVLILCDVSEPGRVCGEVSAK